MLETEREYVQRLKAVKTFFIEPLEKESQFPWCLVKTEQIKTLFSNLPILLNIAEELLKVFSDGKKICDYFLLIFRLGFGRQNAEMEYGQPRGSLAILFFPLFLSPTNLDFIFPSLSSSSFQTQIIGDVFVKMAPIFKIYSEYGNNYEKALPLPLSHSCSSYSISLSLSLFLFLSFSLSLSSHVCLVVWITRGVCRH